MIPAEFEYAAPATLEEARERLTSVSGAKVLGGGMSLIPAMKHRLATPALLVDLGRIPALDGIESRRGRIRIGGRATHAAVGRSNELSDFPIFREAALVIGDRQVRARGTLGGSLVHADPAADWPAVFLALGGEAIVLGRGGERSIAATEFFAGMLATAVADDEILTAVSFAPKTKRAGSAYLKVRNTASGFAVVGIAAALTVDRKGRCDEISIGVTGVNPVPFRARSLEEKLVGQSFDTEFLTRACEGIEEAEPMEDPGASARYRSHLLEVYAVRTLTRAYERARR